MGLWRSGKVERGGEGQWEWEWEWVRWLRSLLRGLGELVRVLLEVGMEMGG